MRILDRIFGGKEQAAEKEFERIAIAVANNAKAKVSKIGEAPLLGKGKAELIEEARKKRQAIEDAVQAGTTAALIAADAIASKHGLSPDQRDKMVARFYARHATK